MNLTVEESQVVYKAEGRTACFDYDEVVGSLRSGMKEIYSKTFKRPIRIEDILGQTDHGVDVARHRLIWDIVRACQKMQDNRDDHLEKLLDNYNSHGLPFLFHVSYVKCPKGNFSSLCAVYHDHLRFHSPAGYGDNQFIQAARCVCDCDGSPHSLSPLRPYPPVTE